MARTLVLMRHANAVFGAFGSDDRIRPLDRVGREQADEAGRVLAACEPPPDFSISSSSARTRETVTRIFAMLDAEVGARFCDELYGASVGQLLAAAQSCDDAHRCLLVCAHNPGVSELVGHFAGRHRLTLPTGGFGRFEFDIDHWGDLGLETDVCCIRLWTPSPRI